jgi:hypothetical protein
MRRYRKCIVIWVTSFGRRADEHAEPTHSSGGSLSRVGMSRLQSRAPPLLLAFSARCGEAVSYQI